jgi:YggT family protein
LTGLTTQGLPQQDELMNEGASFWLFQIPNMILAAAMYTLIGRYILSLLFPHDSDKTIWRAFRGVTDPILKFVRIATPAVVPNGLVMVLAIFWMLVLRIVLLIAAILLGFAPKVGG